MTESSPRAAPQREEPVAWLEAEPSPRTVGDYRVLFPLGAGGMGTVYAAEVGARGAERFVALKLMRRDTPGAARAAFVREGRLTARIDHPNVVATLDLGEADGRPFIVMELVVGVALAELVSRLRAARARLDPALVGFVVASIADGLHAAHELADESGAPLHLVHRDVSPHNVLLGFDGRVLVSDFGIAKLEHGATTTVEGVVKGKLAYMSPEQVSGGVLDRRSDLFSLGVVLHELLTGHRLFVGETPAAVAMAVANRQVAPLPEDVPVAIAAVAMRCLEKDPERRYATAAEVADALRATGVADATALAAALAARCGDVQADLASRFEGVRTARGRVGIFGGRRRVVGIAVAMLVAAAVAAGIASMRAPAVVAPAPSSPPQPSIAAALAAASDAPQSTAPLASPPSSSSGNVAASAPRTAPRARPALKPSPGASAPPAQGAVFRSLE